MVWTQRILEKELELANALQCLPVALIVRNISNGPVISILKEKTTIMKFSSTHSKLLLAKDNIYVILVIILLC